MENIYEMMLISRIGLSESDEKKLPEKLKKFLENKGKVLNQKDLGKKQLAYNIKKEKEGKYWLFDLEIQGDTVSQFSNKIKLEEDILRFLIIRKMRAQVKSEKPKILKEDEKPTKVTMKRRK